ncbi:CHAT domain-containing tetratricopeptide repeat protein [Calothrix sp. UHCC 0171]|uniref:CHAT domain-containing protein n=1 Tax=Calothrix sp. UHCC 0171 TaxID=3110245 RepID=UPI002B21F9DA|nr:CHAT domain-containing tetratricopeptide repeat protein [Calothrix sp. UHCC 0171]MEA5573480.1 CHAT domain-containing tetratricopeptide repeat protein [Calothrix sp. UHCC 0171]
MGVKKVSLGVLVIFLSASAIALPSAKPVSIPLAQVTHNSREAEAERLLKLGVKQLESSQLKASLESFQKALVIYREIKHPSGESAALGNLGAANIALGNYQKGIEYEEQRLAIARKTEDRESEGKGLGNIGSAYMNLGNYTKAIDYLQQSLAIARETVDSQTEKNANINLAQVYLDKGDYQKADEYFQQLLIIVQKTGSKKEELSFLSQISSIHMRRRNYGDAMKYLEKSLEIARETNDLRSEIVALGNIAMTNSYLGNYSRGIDDAEQALKIIQKLNLPENEISTLKSNAFNLLGVLHKDIGNYNEAFDNISRSLSLAKKYQDRELEAKALGNLASIFNKLGKYKEAINYQEQSLKIKREIPDREGEGNSLGNLAIIYRQMGDYSKAIDYGKQVVAITREQKDRENEQIALQNLGLAYYRQGNLLLAESTLMEAIKVQESLRVRLKDTDRISIIDKQTDSFQSLQQVFIKQNKYKEALEISERGRARAFSELINFRLSDNTKQNSPISPLKIEDIRQIAKRQNATLVEYSISDYSTFAATYTPIKGEKFQVIPLKEGFRVSQSIASELSIWVIKPTGEVTFRQVNIESLLRQQKTSLQDLVNNNLKDLGVAIDSPRSANNQQNNQQNFAIDDLVRRNTEDREKDPPWKVVAVNPQNMTVKIRLTTWEKTETPIERTFAQVTKVSYSQAAYTNLQQLHKILIDPIADLLPKDPNARVIFIPQDSLFFVPFPALQDANRNYLIQKHTIQTAPSIQVLDLTHQQLSYQQRQKFSPEPTDALIVGNPTMPKVSLKPGEPATRLNPLPDAEEEVKKIAQIFKTNPIIGDRATKSAILPLLPKARIIHFATHGLLDDFTAGSIPGAIALAPEVFNNKGKTEETNGLLTASEIFDLKLNAELVVLSACDTGRGKLSGDGVIGLSRSLISAGVPSVIVSLWSIPDAPTASLMTEFYQNLHKGKAFALRQAMLETMKQHPDPKNWAAFTLIGESN